MSTNDDPTTVLVVEDDPSVAELLTTALGARHHTVVVTRTREAALEAARVISPGVVILDLGLPDLDGLDVCARLRSSSDVPIVVLSADGDEERKVSALDLGADDYVTKPFSTPELMARLRVARRNRSATIETGPRRLSAGLVILDTDAHAVTVEGERVHLTQKEYRLAIVLIGRAGSVVTHASIMKDLWPTGGGSPESLRVHVTNLRRKLEPGGVEILTETGVGYRLVVADEELAPNHS